MHWLEKTLEHLWETFDGSAIVFIAALCLLCYAGKKLDETAHPHTLLPQAFSKLTLWLAYLFTWFLGLHWGTRNFFHAPSWMIVIIANLFVFIFFKRILLQSFISSATRILIELILRIL